MLSLIQSQGSMRKEQEPKTYFGAIGSSMKRSLRIAETRNGRSSGKSNILSYVIQICLLGISTTRVEHIRKNPRRRREMKVTDFAVKVAKKEKGKKEINIAQIKEIMKVSNKILQGEFYKLIRKI
jgi:hypothetical protein